MRAWEKLFVFVFLFLLLLLLLLMEKCQKYFFSGGGGSHLIPPCHVFCRFLSVLYAGVVPELPALLVITT